MEKNRIIVEVSGGSVTAIYATRPDEVFAFVVDHDDAESAGVAPLPHAQPVLEIEAAEDADIRVLG